MSDSLKQQLLDRIYASAWQVDALDEALRGLANLCRSSSAGLFQLDSSGLAWEQSFNMPADFMGEFEAQIVPRDPRIAHCLSQPLMTPMRDDEPTLRRAMHETGVDAFARRHDLPYTLACVVERAAASSALAFYVSRSSDDGKPDDAQLDTFMQYVPHLARAMTLRRHIRSDLATASQIRQQGDDAVIGVLGLDNHLRLCWLDGEAEQLLNQCDGVCLRAAALHFDDRSVGRQFARLLRAQANGRQDVGKQVCLAQHQPPGWLMLQPLRNASPARQGQPALLVRLERTVCQAIQSPHANTLTLTPRQHQVLTLVADGLLSKQIGAQLGITENTVRNHIQQLLRMFGVPNRTACVARARACGLLDQSSRSSSMRGVERALVIPQR